MSNEDVRELALVMANEAVEAIDFLTLTESAEDYGFDLTEDELTQAYEMAIRAAVVIPNA